MINLIGAEKKENILKERSFYFALHVIEIYKLLSGKNREFILSKQILKSGTAIGALIREAEYAESKKDFIHKLSIALKEANETAYWIELLFKSDFINKNSFDELNDKITELMKLLISSIKTCKGK